MMILKEDNGVISWKQFKQYQIHLFHPLSAVEEQLKAICTVSKEKKSFIIDPNGLKNSGINFSNFRINVEKKGLFQSLNKTLPLINGYNKGIFSLLWNEESTKKLVKLFLVLERKGGAKNEEQKKALLSAIGLIALIQRELGLNEFEMLMEKILEKDENRKYFPVDFAI